MRKLSIDYKKKLGVGRTGEVYIVDDETVVKLYYRGKETQQIRKEKELAQKALILGVPTAISFDVVQCDDRLGVIYELLNTKSLSQILTEATDNLSEWITKYAELALQINSIETDDPTFPRIKDWYHHLICSSDAWLSSDEIDGCIRLLNATPYSNRLIHGDLHTKNVMVLNNELITIDMADMCCGHPVFDLAANFLTFQLTPPEQRIYGIGLSGKLSDAVWDGFIKAYFKSPNCFFGSSNDDKNYIAERMKDIMPFAMLKSVLVPAITPNIPQDSLDRVLSNARKNFFPQIDLMIEQINFNW